MTKSGLSALAVFALVLAMGPAQAAERTVALNVANVTCELCGPIVKRTLARVAGVRTVTLTESGERAVATVTFDDAKTDVDALVQATTNAGYPAKLAQ